MSAIGPGDHVECFTQGEPRADGRTFGFRIGNVYRVRQVLTSLCTHHGQRCGGLEFFDMPSSPGGYGWRACCFRPVHRPTTKFMNALMQPAPKEPVAG